MTPGSNRRAGGGAPAIADPGERIMGIRDYPGTIISYVCSDSVTIIIYTSSTGGFRVLAVLVIIRGEGTGGQGLLAFGRENVRVAPSVVRGRKGTKICKFELNRVCDTVIPI